MQFTIDLSNISWNPYYKGITFRYNSEEPGNRCLKKKQNHELSFPESFLNKIPSMKAFW